MGIYFFEGVTIPDYLGILLGPQGPNISYPSLHLILLSSASMVGMFDGSQTVVVSLKLAMRGSTSLINGIGHSVV